MIVADTSAVLSLTTADVLTIILDEFETHTTQVVIEELEATAEYDDTHGAAAETVLDHRDRIDVHDVEARAFESSRIDRGEGSCILLVRDLEADFLLTDDLRALPELHPLVDARVGISPIVLKALLKRGVLSQEEAREKLDQPAETRDWLGAPIYRRARSLFEDR